MRTGSMFLRTRLSMVCSFKVRSNDLAIPCVDWLTTKVRLCTITRNLRRECCAGCTAAPWSRDGHRLQMPKPRSRHEVPSGDCVARSPAKTVPASEHRYSGQASYRVLYARECRCYPFEQRRDCFGEIELQSPGALQGDERQIVREPAPSVL